MKSLLFVPADRPERFIKAQNAGANAIILDLEDSVADDHKELARTHIVEFDKTLNHRSVWVRINAQNSTHYQADIACVRTCTQLAGVVIPKCEDERALADFYWQTQLPIIAIIETAQGLANVQALAKANGVMALSYGVLDLGRTFGLVVGSRGADSFFNQVRYEILLASKLANIAPPIESIFANFKDNNGLTNYANNAFNMGFGGQLCIHPSQVATVNLSYQPSEDKISFAKSVLTMHEKTGKIAFALDGIMVDLPVIEWAKTVFDRTSQN